MAAKLDPNVQFAGLWANALDKYANRTGRDLTSDAGARDIRTLDDLHSRIKLSNQEFTAFRERHARLWKTISTACMPIQLVGGLAANILEGAQILPANAALGAILHLVNSAKGVSEAYDAVEDLLARIATATQRFNQYAEGTIDEELGRLVTETMCKILEILARTEKLARRPRAQEYFRVTLLGKDEKLQNLLKDLGRLSADEANLVSALNYSSTRRVEKTTQRTEKRIEDISSQFGQSKRENESATDRQQMSVVLNEALAHRMYEIYKSIGRDRVRKTGDWIFDDPLIEEWSERRSAFLWILGVEGVGKSFLSTRIIDEFQSEAYFYIKSDNSSTCSVNNLLKCIAFQLAHHISGYGSFAATVCKDQRRLRIAEDTWKSLFEDYFSVDHLHGSARVIIDGIDEAPVEEQRLLFELMSRLQKKRYQNGYRLQFLILGRPEIEDQWPKKPPPYVEVSATKMSADVVKYIKKNIKRVKLLRYKSKGEREALESRIVERLQEGAGGMFLWAKLMLEEIIDQPRPSDIERLLASPPGVFQLLETIIERLVGDSRTSGNDLRYMLIWSTFATRELYLGEMKLLLELKKPVGEGLPGLESYLREDFRSLFVLDREDGKTTEDLRRMAVPSRITSGSDDLQATRNEENDVSSTTSDNDEHVNRPGFDSDLWTTKISISHSSIREFIRSTNSGVIDTSPNEAHKRIALTCLRSLSGGLPPANGISLPDQTRLQGYCASNYLFHIEQLEVSKISEIDLKEIVSQLLFVLYNKEPLARIIKFRDNDDKFLATYLSKEFHLKIRQWIAVAPIQGMTPALMDWWSSSQWSISLLLEPMAKTIAELWLQGGERPFKMERLSINFYIAFLHAHQHILDAPDIAGKEEIEDVLESISVFDVDRLPYKDIRTVAERTGLAQNSEWYSSVGMALCWNNHDHEAIRFFKEAVKLDQNNSAAHYGLCNSYCELGDYRKSIEMGINYMPLEPNETPMKTDCWYSMNLAANRLDVNDTLILDWGRNRLEAYPRSPEGIYFSIKALYIQGRFVDVLKFVEEIHAEGYPESKSSCLYHLLPRLDCRSLHEVALSAVMARQDQRALNIADELVKYAKSVDDFSRMQIGKYFRGLIYVITNPMSQEALRKFEEIRSDLGSEDRNISRTDFMFHIDDCLGSIYFELAMEARKSGANSGFPVQKLEKLRINPSPSLARQRGRSMQEKIESSVALKLALWYRLERQITQCEELLEPDFQEGIRILRDHNIQNDFEGYFTLTAVLLRAGNIQQAIAAFIPLLLPFSRQQARYRHPEGVKEIAQPPGSSQGILGSNTPKQAAEGAESLEEDLRLLQINQRRVLDIESSHQAKNEASANHLSSSITEKTFSEGLPPVLNIDTGYSVIKCNVACADRIIDDLWVCEYCTLEVVRVMCGKCLRDFKNGSITIFGSQCHRYHPYHRVYPIDEDLKNRATKNVQGRTLPREEWLRELEESWMLPSSSGREYSEISSEIWSDEEEEDEDEDDDEDEEDEEYDDDEYDDDEYDDDEYDDDEYDDDEYDDDEYDDDEYDEDDGDEDEDEEGKEDDEDGKDSKLQSPS